MGDSPVTRLFQPIAERAIHGLESHFTEHFFDCLCARTAAVVTGWAGLQGDSDQNG